MNRSNPSTIVVSKQGDVLIRDESAERRIFLLPRRSVGVFTSCPRRAQLLEVGGLLATALEPLFTAGFNFHCHAIKPITLSIRLTSGLRIYLSEDQAPPPGSGADLAVTGNHPHLLGRSFADALPPDAFEPHPHADVVRYALRHSVQSILGATTVTQ